MASIHINNLEDIIIIHIDGCFNIENLNQVEEVWIEQTNKKPRIIAINCKKLKTVDSSAIGTIVKFFNFAMSKGIMLIFFDMNPLIRKLFATAKLNKFFTITTKSKFENQYGIKNKSSKKKELTRVL